MKAFANQNFIVYRHLSRERLNVSKGDAAEVIWKEDIQSKVKFLDGVAKGTIHTLDNMLLDFEESNLSKVEEVSVPGTKYNLMDYIHGRCHLFAQALHEELGYDVECLWDIDYWFEDAEVPSIVLVHAYGVLPKEKASKEEYVDARGRVSKQTIEQEYECNSKSYERINLEQLKEAIKNKQLCAADPGEIEALRTFIKENKSIFF